MQHIVSSGVKCPGLIVLTVGVALALGPSPEANAGTIVANGINCTLANAILTANTHTNTGGCVLNGAGLRVTIDLTYDVTLTAVDTSVDEDEIEEEGPTGLPPIQGRLTINGNGHTIQRDPALFSFAAGGDDIDPCSGTGAKFRILWVDYPPGKLVLNDVTVKNGCAPPGYGGGGIFHEGHDLTLNRVTIEHNRAGMGGGIFSEESATSINDSTLVANSAQAGGGVFHREGTVNITRSSLIQNSATGSGTVCVTALKQLSCLPAGSGGGTALKRGGTNITDSTLEQNSASGNGGAIYNSEVGTTTVTGSTLAQNSAVGDGGGVFVDNGTVNITNATLAQNSAGGNGGGIFSAGGATRILNATIAENSAAGGNGIFTKRHTDRQVTLTNTLLDNGGGSNCVADGTALFSAGHNIATDSSCKLLSATDHPGVDPKRGAYTDPGTPGNGHYPLLRGSPAIDAGTSSGCPSTDQLGESRIGPCDIGAIEYPRRVKVWLGLGSGANLTLRVDLKVEVFVNSTAAGLGLLNDIAAGGGGFPNAILYTIPVPAVDVPAERLLQLRVSVRRSCSGAGVNSGIVRLWYDGQPVDSAVTRDAGSRLGATIAGVTDDLFLRDGFALDATAGSTRRSIDEPVNGSGTIGCPSRPFIAFGTWGITAAP